MKENITDREQPLRRYIHAWAPSSKRAGLSSTGYCMLRNLTEQEVKELQRKAIHVS